MVNRKSTNNSLIHVENRILIKVWTEEKNHHTFSHGVTIRIERRFDNFNCRETEPIQGSVISGEGIPHGVTILFHHNATHPVNEVFNHKQTSGVDIASQTKIFSVPEADCYAWLDDSGEWKPMKNFDFALRVFIPYSGIISGIEPALMKNTLFGTTGKYSGLVVRTLKACDYEIVFREPKSGQENDDTTNVTVH